ncbi:MAG: hypothetical protein KDB27_18350, partial [Planctomycetales bacterium]|nr:hypothetical protein [Planctomycetales bacterium]
MQERERCIRFWHLAFWTTVTLCISSAAQSGELRCGASAIDVTPQHLPVIRNGGFLQAEDTKVVDPLHSRCLVVDDGENRIAIVVVDSCMMPLSVCDEAKVLANKATGIPTDHIMISATHTHTAPSVMRYCLGSGIDERYRKFLIPKIAESIEVANARLKRAKIGWTRVDASNFTRCRRWITRTDKLQRDPFDELTVHANMHPGHLNPDFVGPSGPADPWLSLLMVRDTDDRPMALFANLSMHYFSGHAGVSADYYGQFAQKIAQQLAPDDDQFVGIMSQGTSGDLWWGDYSQPADKKPFQSVDEFISQLADLAAAAVEKIEYTTESPVRLAETRVTINRRLPNEKRLAWARRLNQLRGDRLPKDRPEVYAQQAIYLHENPTDEVVLQAIRLGDLAITGMPNEVYGLTGLKLKRRSPLDMTFNISLANGACGYIPPPEQHALGGYNTWPARTAGLDESAEPIIVNTVLHLLEQVSERPRKTYVEPPTQFSKHVVATNPQAYWRLAEMERTDFVDASGNNSSLRSTGFVAFHLPGREGNGFGAKHDTHSIQLAGGKLVADSLELGESYSVQLSFYLGTASDFRATTGTLISRGHDAVVITGAASETPGRISVGDQTGSTSIARDRWHQLIFVRNGNFAQVFLDSADQPEISFKTERPKTDSKLFFGGDLADTSNFEGKLDEISVYDRALTIEEIRDLFRIANHGTTKPQDTRLDSEPLDAETSLNQIHVRDGYRVELVAAEPLVVDPVAVDWGADGKLWVAEMADYPMGMDNEGKPGGRIRFLEDTDMDGKYDKSTVFLKDVGFPNGVMAWRDGVLVTAAPEIFFAADTDGDGVADKRETLFSGFMTGNQQLRVNGLRWGLDNMVHCASGAHHSGFGSGNEIFSDLQGKSIPIGSRDFRFDPTTGFIDPQSGPSQYGRVRDDFGNWFGVQNSQPLWHYVLQDHYQRRNTKVASIDPRHQVRQPRMPEVYSAKPPQRRFHGFDHAGHYTSACGIGIYRDDLLFPRNEIHAFTCEPFHNLVQHHLLTPYATTFRGERADDGPVDFFASTDRWTRPVMARTGPDGALWIVDMYRYMIEHPEWLPQDGKDALRAGYRAGDDRGRIYRIVPAETDARSMSVSFRDLTNDEIVDKLEDPSGIVRDLAHRTLLARIGAVDTRRVRRIAEDAELPESRIQALAVLDGLGELSVDSIRTAVSDNDPHVRRHAILLAERLNSHDVLPSGVLALENDSDAKVRLQLAASIGQWATKDAGMVLARLALRNDSDVFTQAAIISSFPQHFKTVSDELAARCQFVPTEIMDALLLMGSYNPDQLANTLQRILGSKASDQFKFGTIARWTDSLAEQNQTMDSLASKNKQLTGVQSEIRALISDAIFASEDSTAELEIRTNAIKLLGRDPTAYDRDIDVLVRLLGSSESTAIQSAAIQRLGGIPTQAAADAIIGHWTEYLPKQQEQAASAMLNRAAWIPKLMDAIESGAVRPNDFGLAQQQSLRNHHDGRIASRAKMLFGDGSRSDR